ncbi:T9SS type A sorting domain-containing protein, partial [Flavobacterium lindanitolerans]
DSSAQVNISDLSAGVYMMNINSDQGSVTKKIIKN